MKRIVSFGREVPGLTSKAKRTNGCALEANKNWLGEYVVGAIDSEGKRVGEKIFENRLELELWLRVRFARRLYPSDIEKIADTVEQGEKAEFPIRIRRHDALRYGLRSLA